MEGCRSFGFTRRDDPKMADEALCDGATAYLRFFDAISTVYVDGSGGPLPPIPPTRRTPVCSQIRADPSLIYNSEKGLVFRFNPYTSEKIELFVWLVGHTSTMASYDRFRLVVAKVWIAISTRPRPNPRTAALCPISGEGKLCLRPKADVGTRIINGRNAPSIRTLNEPPEPT